MLCVPFATLCAFVPLRHCRSGCILVKPINNLYETANVCVKFVKLNHCNELCVCSVQIYVHVCHCDRAGQCAHLVSELIVSDCRNYVCVPFVVLNHLNIVCVSHCIFVCVCITAGQDVYLPGQLSIRRDMLYASAQVIHLSNVIKLCVPRADLCACVNV